MPALNVKIDGDGCWPDLKSDSIIDLMTNAPTIHLALLRKGTAEGNSAVVIRIDTPDGKSILTQTTMKLFRVASKLLIDADSPEIDVERTASTLLKLWETGSADTIPLVLENLTPLQASAVTAKLSAWLFERGESLF